MPASEAPPEITVRGVRYTRDASPSSAGLRYRAHPGGGTAVPTGRVFVRVAPGARVSEHAEALAKAGYSVAEVPSWAPESAWLVAADGRVESALERLGELARVPALEHAEPELLRPRARRGTDDTP